MNCRKSLRVIIKRTLFLSLIVTLSVLSLGFSQAPFPKTLTINDNIIEDSLDIQSIDLGYNKLLLREIQKFIKEQKDSLQLFRDGFGYVTVGNIQLHNPGPLPVDSIDKHKNDITVTFHMALSSYVLSDNPIVFCSHCFPVYYSYVDNTLVLIYDSEIKWIHNNQYSQSSKQKIFKLVRKSLLKSLDSDFVFKELINKKEYKLNEDQRATMKEIEILNHAAFSLTKSKTYIQCYDERVYYKYYK